SAPGVQAERLDLGAANRRATDFEPRIAKVMPLVAHGQQTTARFPVLWRDLVPTARWDDLRNPQRHLRQVRQARPPRQPLMTVEGAGLRQTLPVELSSVDRLYEALPRLGGEAQYWSRTVLAVADLNGVVNLPNLHAGTVLSTAAASPPHLVDRWQRVSP